jgi:hypothetical protein
MDGKSSTGQSHSKAIAHHGGKHVTLHETTLMFTEVWYGHLQAVTLPLQAVALPLQAVALPLQAALSLQVVQAVALPLQAVALPLQAALSLQVVQAAALPLQAAALPLQAALSLQMASMLQVVPSMMKHLSRQIVFFCFLCGS